MGVYGGVLLIAGKPAPTGQPRSMTVPEAAHWLTGQLASGPREMSQVRQAARAQQISLVALYGARKATGAASLTRHAGGRMTTYWLSAEHVQARTARIRTWLADQLSTGSPVRRSDLLGRLPTVQLPVSAGELDEAAEALRVVVSTAPNHRTAVQWCLPGQTPRDDREPRSASAEDTPGRRLARRGQRWQPRRPVARARRRRVSA